MKRRSLYPALFAWVLLLLGCNTDTTPSDTAAPAESGTSGAVASEPSATSDDDAIRVLVLGNSLAAGYGLSDSRQAFPGLIQQKADALGWDVNVVNAGVSGETTAGGLSRIDWLLRQPVDVLVLELGGNDGLRGIAPEVTEANLQAIIDKTRARYPEARIVIAGMQIPPNLGASYTQAFRDVYPTLAERNDVALIPFLLEGVGGVPSLNLPDGIHPTAEGHRIVAETVWSVLRPVLEDVRAAENAEA